MDCGRKLEHPEETHAYMRRMCKLYTDSDPSQESNPGPWSCEAAVLTTVHILAGILLPRPPLGIGAVEGADHGKIH